MRLKQTYSSREVAAMTGVSARQLQLWDAGGLLSPAVPSHRTEAGGYTERRYTPIELFEVLVLADLRRRGFTVPQLRMGSSNRCDSSSGASVRCDRRRRTRPALTDGHEIYARTATARFSTCWNARPADARHR